MTNKPHINTYSDGPVWDMFGLTYASYAVFPRRALCSMPLEWQEKWVALVKEMHARLPEGTADGEYMVKRRYNGKFIKDPMSKYRHAGPLPLKDVKDKP